jgi:hypothetical protein
MPKTPSGARRPAAVIGNAVHVMRIATRQVEEKSEPKNEAASEMAARAARLGPQSCPQPSGGLSQKKLQQSVGPS